ncbi:MAG TPA: ABC transporter ATP-binding protein, partial [Armatimonadetes bacterium]|nr:ABC transporter ATP-binding protein [Armatimonadota bacterium]
MVGVKLKDVTKRFGTTIAVNTVSLDVNRGELFFLLGPSGCGKTTLLRLIAGFVEPDAGEIWFDGRLMNNVPAHLRNAAMVFQNYALFPHMTVWENVAYGLRLRNLSKREQAERIRWALELVRMSEFKDRYPGQLSGGQQQRIALARALIVQPDVLLLDEPLSNLDARLRAEMRREIKRIHRQLRITTIYVTHDQKEALSMADRIAVMRNGCVEQVGTPRELYYHP